ncbi:hypothetical protein FRB98_004411, partial [Tulasnella sp. 332]
TEPEEYARLVKEYCWDGNRSTDFVVQNNPIRAWYHAPWMHASTNGREPLKGLTFERPTPPLELASQQTHALQNWAIGFYNAPGASLFGHVWNDPNNPNWAEDLKFPDGTCVFKLLMTTASNEQVFTMKGSPGWPAVIAPQPDPCIAPINGAKRNSHASLVRLIQVDWAVVDWRAPIRWVFGTFMYDGTLKGVEDPWNRLSLVGVQWGNDPILDQAAYDAGRRPVESWLNPQVEALRKRLGGRRLGWGFNGRLNGPADNFISACGSCHSFAQRNPGPLARAGRVVQNKRIIQNERPATTRLDGTNVQGAVSGDYSMQLMKGFDNYENWLAKQTSKEKNVLLSLPGRRVVFKPKL